MLVDFLWQNLEKIGTLATRTVGTMFAHLPLGKRRIIFPSFPLIESFFLLLAYLFLLLSFSSNFFSGRKSDGEYNGDRCVHLDDSKTS
jgi:hypothetical protein